MSGEAYVKRYGAGGFVDLPAQTTSIDSQFLNGVEAALARLLGVDPTDKFVQVWDAGLGRFKTVLLTAINLDPAAGILKSQLAPLAITDADIAAGANIAAPRWAATSLSPSCSFRRPAAILLASGTYTTPGGRRAILVECVGAVLVEAEPIVTVAGQSRWVAEEAARAYSASLILAPAATYAFVIGAAGGGAAGVGVAQRGCRTRHHLRRGPAGRQGWLRRDEPRRRLRSRRLGRRRCRWLDDRRCGRCKGAGGGGGAGIVFGGIANVVLGAGGAGAVYGTQTQAVSTAASGGVSGQQYGGGGGGAGRGSSTSSQTGGTGAPGIIVVTEYY